MASIFTKIVAGEIPCYKIAENDNFLAFFDINPLQKGHTLVIPKKEVDYIFDLDDQTLSDMMIFAKKVANAIKSTVECKRVAVVVLGMEVPHAHIHLIPMNSEGDVDFKKTKVKMTNGEFTELAKQINENI